MRLKLLFLSAIFLGFLGVFLDMNVEAADYAKWARHEYSDPAAVLKMGVGDINGDGIKETVAISMEGPSIEFERRSPDGRLQSELLEEMQGAKVYPNPYMPQGGHEGVCFDLSSQQMGSVTGSITVNIRNSSGGRVRTLEMPEGYQLFWDGKDDSDSPVPVGVYSFTISVHQMEICGNLLIGIDHLPDTSMRIKVLSLAEPDAGEIMGEVVVDGSLAGLGAYLQVADIDSDGKDEIIFGLGNVPDAASNPFPDNASIYIYGWSENGLVQEYRSPEIINGRGIISALAVGDTDGNGNKEILVGITRGNKTNLDATGDNFNLLDSYIGDKKYLAAANLLSSGLLKGSLFNAEIVRIESLGTNTFCAPDVHPAGHGFLYRLTCGKLDDDAADDEVLADVSDLNYKNLNKFIEDLAWEMAKGSKTEFSLAPPLNPAPSLSPDGAAPSSPISSVLPTIGMMLSNPAIQAVIPQAEAVSGIMNLMGPKQMPDTTTVDEASRFVSSHKAGAPPMDKMEENGYYGGYHHPWYSDNVNEELISWTEKTLLPDGANYPDIAGPLVEGRLRVFNWNGSAGYDVQESPNRVGAFSLDTVITKDKQIVVKGIEGQHGPVKNLIDSIMNNLVSVEKVTRERFVEPWSGEQRIDYQTDVLPKGVPQLTGEFLVGKLSKFDGSSLNRIWQSQPTGAFGSDVRVKDMDGVTGDEIVVTTGRVDWTKVNDILQQLDVQFKLMLGAERAGKKNVFIFAPPTIPENIIASGIEVYDAAGTKIWESGVLAPFIAGMDSLGTNTEGRHEIGLGVVQFDSSVLNNYIKKWQDAVSTAQTAREAWFTDSFTVFMQDLLPEIEVYNNWAKEWRNNGCQWGYTGGNYLNWGPINPERPNIDWSGYPEMPEIIEPDVPSDSEINSILTAKIATYEWQDNSFVKSWESSRLGHILTNMIAQDVDGVSSLKEMVAAGIDLEPLFDENPPQTRIHAFKDKSSGGAATLVGMVTGAMGQSLSGAIVEVSKDGQTLGSGTTSIEGTYTISVGLLQAGTYSVKGLYVEYSAAAEAMLWPDKTTCLDLQIMNYSQYLLVNGATSTVINADEPATITANTTGRVNLCLYIDNGTVGVLDADDVMLESWFMDDGSWIDEDGATGIIQQQQHIFWGDAMDGNLILQAVDEMTGASSYAGVVGTQTVMSQSISGKVTVNGVSASNVMVNAYSNSNDENIAVLTDSNGDYTIYVPAGDWEIGVLRLGYEGIWQDVHVNEGSHTTVNFSLNDTLGLVSISGHVQTPDGKPIPGAEINATSKEGRSWIFNITDINGNYTLHVPSGTSYTIGASKQGYGNGNEEKSGVAGPAANIDFILTPYTDTVTGIVTDDSEEPIPWANVNASQEGSYFDAQSNLVGRYLMYVPQNTSWNMHAQATGYAGASVSGISAGATNVNLILLPYNGTISGTVYGPDGTTTMAGVSVNAWIDPPEQGLDDYVHTKTGPDGSYVLDVLEGRMYRVDAWADGYYGSNIYATASATNVDIIMNRSTSSPLIITTESLPQAEVGIGYTAFLSVTGGSYYNYTWSATNTPSWLNVTTSGMLFGTPTDAGTDTITVQVMDSRGSTATRQLDMLIAPQWWGSIMGTITYAGTKTGTAYLLSINGDREPAWMGTLAINGANDYPFIIPQVKPGIHSLACWLDASPPYGMGTKPGPGDMVGSYGGFIGLIDGTVEIVGTPTPIIVEQGSTTTVPEFGLDVVVPYPELDLKVNGTSTATVPQSSTFTLTCNLAGRVEFLMYHDTESIGVLEQSDTVVPWSLVDVDNSPSDESPATGTIKRTVVAFNGKPMVSGNFIIQAVDVETRATDEIAVNLTQPAFPQSISGRVTVDGNTQANIVVMANNGADGAEVVVVTDSLGAYILTLPTSGVWGVKAYKKGYPCSAIQYIYVADNADVVDVNMALTTNNLSTISGQVFMGINPMPGVIVMARTENEDNEVWVGTDVNGNYTLHVIPGKIWTLEAERAGYNSHPTLLSIHDLPATHVNFILSPNTMPISGTVTGSGPISNAIVQGWCEGYSRVSAQTNENGRYTLFVPSSSGKWDISAQAKGSARTDRRAYPGESEINIDLDWHDAAITGTVYRQDGMNMIGVEMAKVRIECQSMGLEDGAEVWTNPDGTYQLPAVRGYKYVVSCKKQGYESPASQEIYAPATVNFILPSCDLGISKWAGEADPDERNGVGYCLPGGTITYHIVYENQQAKAHNVKIIDMLPDGARYIKQTSNFLFTQDGKNLTWDIGSLNPGENGHFELKVVVGTDSLINTLVNVILIATTDDERYKINNTATWTTQVFEVDVAAKKIGPKAATPGQEISYRLMWKNNGVKDSGSITVTDILPKGVTYLGSTLGTPSTTDGGTLTWTCGSLLPGGTASVDITVRVGTDTEISELVNVILIACEEEDGPLYNNRATWTTRIGVPDLSISKCGPGEVIPGSEISYDINFQNVGETGARDITITDTLPPLVTYISNTLLGTPGITGSGTPESPQVLTWKIDELLSEWEMGSGGFGYFNLICQAGESFGSETSLSNVICISNAMNEKNTENNRATWTTQIQKPYLDLGISKSGEYEVVAGRKTSYWVKYYNNSNVSVRDIAIIDALPDGVKYAGMGGEIGMGGSYNDKIGTPTIGTSTGTEILTWMISSLAAWEEGCFEFVVGVEDKVTSGVLVNTITITNLPGEDTTNNEAIVSTNVILPVPDLSIGKDGPWRATRGETITYSVWVNNNSRFEAKGVKVIDYLPEGVQYATNTMGIEPNTSNGTNTLIWDLDILSPWQGGYFQITGVIDETASDTLTNVVEVITNGTESNMENNRATVITQVEDRSFDLFINKGGSWWNEGAISGQDYTYYINFGNQGNAEVGSVTIVDTLPVGASYVSNTGELGSPTIMGSGTAGSPYILIWELDSLSPSSGYWNNYFELTLRLGDETGELANVVEISTSMPGTETDESNNYSTFTVQVSKPFVDLSISKSGWPDEVAPGQEITYWISYSNKGNSPSGAGTITDTLPTGVTYVETVDNWWYNNRLGTPTQNDNILQWYFESISPWEYGWLQIRVKVNEGATATLTNNISILPIDDNSENNGASCITRVVSPTVDLSVQKWGPSEIVRDSASGGEKISYTIILRNSGNSDARGVSVVDTLPVGVTYKEDTSGRTHTITGSGTPESPYQITWNYGTLTMSGWREVVRFELIGIVSPTASTTLTNAVEILCSQDNNPDNNRDAVTTYIVQPEADLGVWKGGDIEGVPGQEINYTVYYWNKGNATAEGAKIIDYLPVGLEYISDTGGGTIATTTARGTKIRWEIGDVDPGWNGYGYFTIKARIASNVTVNSVLSNVIDIKSLTPESYQENNRATATITVVAPMADLSISKHAAVRQVSEGDEINYWISYQNNGNSQGLNVVITDYLPDGVSYGTDTLGVTPVVSTNTISWNLGTVMPNDGKSFKLTLKVNEAVSTLLTNVIVMNSDTDEENAADNQATATVSVILEDKKAQFASDKPQVDLMIKKNGPTQASVGQEVVYHITYNNQSAVAASNVIITDTLPAGMNFASSDLPATVTNNQVVWNIGAVKGWSKKTFKMRAMVGDVPASSTLTNIIEIKTDSGETDYTNNKDTASTHIIVPEPDLVISKWGEMEVTAGHKMDYQIRCINQGTGKASNVVIWDTLDNRVSFVSSTKQITGTQSGIITWNMGDIEPGESVNFSLTVMVGSMVAASTTLTNVVEVTSVGSESTLSNNRATATTNVVQPIVDLSVYKFGPREVLIGKDIEYTINYANHSSSDALGAIITDTLDAGMKYVSNTSGIKPTTDGNKIIWAIGTISAWEVKSFKVTVSQVVAASTTLTNKIEITSLSAEDNLKNNQATSTTHVAAAKVDVKVSKWGTEARPGFEKTYYITYSNIGTMQSDDVKLIDTLDANVEYLYSSPSGSYDSLSHSITWQTGSLDAQTDKYCQVVVRVKEETKDGVNIYNTIEVTTTSDESDYTNNKYTEVETVVTSMDPNDKVASPARCLKDNQLIDYTIHFENMATASASAILVKVIDRLDPAGFDLSSMVPEEVGVGDIVYASVDAFNQSGRGSLSYSYDSTSGTITWLFNFKTGSNGIPPNVTPHEGEGFVNFSVKTKPGLGNGTVITNTADIRFDYNEWMTTPATEHVVDFTPPASNILPLTATQTNVSFAVSWTGTDTAGGTHGAISSYTIEVSDNGGVFTSWIKDTIATTSTFYGQAGHSYSFRSVARDEAGNVEAETGSDTTTFITVGPMFRINPATKTVSKGDAFSLDVELGCAPDFTIIETHLAFDPYLLEVTGISSGSFPAGGSVISSTYTNTLGKIAYAVGLFSGTSSGTGTVMKINLKAKAGGEALISFNTVKTLLLNDLQAIPFNTENGTVSISQLGVGRVQGFVVLDIPRVSGHARVAVKIEGTSLGTITDASGYFCIENVSPGVVYGTVSTYIAGASPRVWNNIIVPSGGTLTLGTMTLLNADADGSLAVNGFDFGYLRKAYFKNSMDVLWQDKGIQTRDGYINCDFNGDGNVNAFDFGALRLNYFKEVAATYSAPSPSPAPPAPAPPLIRANEGTLTTLKVEPATKDVLIGSTFTVGISLEYAPEFTGVDLRLCFNPGVLEVATFTSGGFPGSATILTSSYNNGSGTIDYGVGIPYGQDPATGSGQVLNIVFKAKAIGASTIGFSLDDPRKTLIVNGTTAVSFATIGGTMTVRQNTELIVGASATAYGDGVDLRGTITDDEGSALPVGEVLEFKVDGTWVGSSTTNGSGVGTISYIASLAPGTHTITISYAGNGSYTASSGTSTLTVSKEDTAVVVGSATVAYSDTVELQSTLKDNDGLVLVGEVLEFKVDGTWVGSITTNGSGVGTISYIASLAPGIHTITISYAGSGSYTASSGTSTLMVSKKDTAVVVGSATVAYGDAVELRGTLKDNDGVVLVGEVLEFKIGTMTVGTGSTKSGGVGTVSYIANLAPGTYTLTISYAGSGSYTASSGTNTLRIGIGANGTQTVAVADGEIEVAISNNTATVFPEIAAVTTSVPAFENAKQIGGCYEITISGIGTATINITLPYTSQDVAGRNEKGLRIYYLDNGKWVKASDVQEVDTAGNKVTVYGVKHLSKFAIFSTAANRLEKVIAYPNPYIAGANTVITFGHPSDSGLQLTCQATIKVYNIAGELVATLEETNGDGILQWNATNDDGEKLASGVYIYLVTNPREERYIGKLAIVR